MSALNAFQRSMLSIIACALFLSSGLRVNAAATPDSTVQTQTIQTSRPFPPTQYIPDHDFDTRHNTLDAANITTTGIKLSSGTPLQFTTDVAKQKVNVTLNRSYQPSDELTITI